MPWTEIDRAALIPAWDALARTAAEPNPFYEPGFLIPSLEQFDPAGKVHLAMLVDGGRLTGLMPSWRDRDYHGHPLPNIAAWQHPNAFCGVPLVAPGHEGRFWRAYLECVDSKAGKSLLLHLPQMPGDSSVTAALLQLCEDSGRSCRTVHREQRALLRSGLAPEEHLTSAMSTKKRKELRRQSNRLADEGEVRFERRRDESGLTEWSADFLALEQRGWKGANGSALACDPRTETLFVTTLANAAAAGRLERLTLWCADRPVAMLATFLAAPGAFAFKTTFDEDFARFSPGMLLQVENLALLDDPRIAWCDSCAAADHPMIERIWRDRREMVGLSIAIGGKLRRRLGASLAAIEAHRVEKRA
ncbi:GNAT family N-acetyltransferase [Qipengyuania marisflavi]|uniref:GNAT family N-acetyltransferase n=1 Tax=Qipengyuania marisflavi TaxID=2486356 RepID=A0A5S3P7U4_9SPHN|nr:GNAT family N-acetyltransferase [Qipengyuania marisflavi]